MHQQIWAKCVIALLFNQHLLLKSISRLAHIATSLVYKYSLLYLRSKINSFQIWRPENEPYILSYLTTATTSLPNLNGFLTHPIQAADVESKWGNDASQKFALLSLSIRQAVLADDPKKPQAYSATRTNWSVKENQNDNPEDTEEILEIVKKCSWLKAGSSGSSAAVQGYSKSKVKKNWLARNTGSLKESF